jgi:hypothetical protein
MTKSYTELTSVQFKQLATLKEQIEGLERKLAAVLTSSGSGAPASAPAKRKPRTGAVAKVKSGAALKARRAKAKTKAAAGAAKPVKTKKFTMSDEAKAAISRAAKARWAKFRAERKG